MSPRSHRWILVGLLVCAQAPAAALEVVYVVRHAQKDLAWTGTDDRLRPLSDKGDACAERLARTLRNQAMGIATVYVSPEITRTYSTGRAVARANGGVPVEQEAKTLRPKAGFVRAIRRRHANDRAILIVGHSTTVDDLVLAFKPKAKGCLCKLHLEQPKIPEEQYGDIWRLDAGPGSKSACEGGVQWRSLGTVDGVDCTTP